MEQRIFCWFWLVLLLSFYQNQQKIGSYAKTSCPSKNKLHRSKLFSMANYHQSRLNIKINHDQKKSTMAMIYTVSPLDPSFNSNRFTSNWRLTFWWWVLGTINNQFLLRIAQLLIDFERLQKSSIWLFS